MCPKNIGSALRTRVNQSLCGAVRTCFGVVPVVLPPRHRLQLEHVLPHVGGDLLVTLDLLLARAFGPRKAAHVADPFLQKQATIKTSIEQTNQTKQVNEHKKQTNKNKYSGVNK